LQNLGRTLTRDFANPELLVIKSWADLYSPTTLGTCAQSIRIAVERAADG
jgi:hypothetical protein